MIFSFTRIALVVLLVGPGVAPSAAAQEPDPIAVVVHPSNPATGMTLDDLRRFYLGSVTIFDNGERVNLVESSDDRGRFYRVALRMGEDRLQRHWVGRVFAGQAGRPPEAIRNPAQLIDYVARTPGAIGFVRADAANSSVKVIPIDGRRPGDVDYPIR